VLTPALQQRGVWDPVDGAAIAGALKPGMTAVDIGAHVGYFALLAAQCVGRTGRVVAVEAAPDNFALLRANVARTRARHVSVTHAAAWNRSGTLSLRLSSTNTGDHRVFAHDEAAQAVTVPSIRMDDLLQAESRVDFVLLDTQGSERAVLEGMTRTLERFRPRIQAEFWPHGIRGLGDDPRQMMSFYRELDYDVAVLGSSQAVEENGDRLVELAEATVGGFCTLVLSPCERGAR
jgi:FkbM family methyltransferase